VFVGQYFDAKPHGQGKMKYSHGAEYDGHWNNGIIHGQGKYTWPDGSVYEGNFKDI